MMQNHNKTQKHIHSEIALAIKGAKKALLKHHSEGGDLEKLIAVFAADVAIRLRKIAPLEGDPLAQPEPGVNATHNEKSDELDLRLDDEEIEKLARMICLAGDDPERKTAAFVYLMNEIFTTGDTEIAETAARA